MSFKLVLVFILFSTLALSQNNRDSSGLKQGKWTFKIDYDSVCGIEDVFVITTFIDDTISGLYSVYDSNESLRYEVACEHGLREGLGVFYDSQSKVIKAHTYYNGKLISELSFFDKNKVYGMISYSNNMKNGMSYRLYNNGRVTNKKQYFEDEINGKEISLKKNGKVRVIYFFENDVLMKTIP